MVQLWEGFEYKKEEQIIEKTWHNWEVAILPGCSGARGSLGNVCGGGQDKDQALHIAE